MEIKKCKNCQQELNDQMVYCPKCGQKNASVMITAWQLFLDLFTSLFNIDNKFFRTLTSVFMPAKLTNKYFEGKRQTYSHPLRYYLFISFILFGILSFQLNRSFQSSTFFEKLDVSKSLKEKQDVRLLDSLSGMLASKSSNKDYINGSRSLLYLYLDQNQENRPPDTIANSISNLTFTPDTITKQQSYPGSDSILFNYTTETMAFREIMDLHDERINSQLEEDSISLGLNGFGIDDQNINQKFALKDLISAKPKEFFEKYQIKGFWRKLYLGQSMKIIREPENAVLYFLSGFSWVAILFIPFISLWLKLIFIRRRFYFVEHMVFSIHTTSFLFILMILYLLLEYTTGAQWSAFVLLSFPFYLIIAHKKYYKQGIIKSLFKSIAGMVAGVQLIFLLLLLSIFIRMLIF